jgi:hypothetical protein
MLMMANSDKLGSKYMAYRGNSRKTGPFACNKTLKLMEEWNMEVFSKIIYKNKMIYYLDYSAFQNDKDRKEKTLQLMKTAADTWSVQPKNSVLSLLNLNNFYFDMDILNAFKESASRTSENEKKMALIGVKGLIKTGYNFVIGLTQNSKVKVFDTEAEAKEWLVKD